MIKTIQRRTRDAFVLVLFIPALLGALTFWLDRRSNDSVEWVAHTRDVLSSIDRVLLRAHAAESSQRGFLLTGDSAYLQRYTLRTHEVSEELARLRELTADNRGQDANNRALSTLWSHRLARMDEVLAWRETGKLPQTSAVNAMHTGRKLMDSMDDMAGRMIAEENRLLVIRTLAQRRAETEVAVFFVLGLLINVGLLYWAYQLVKQYGLARDVAEMEIRRINTDLEQRVHERTAELEESNEKLSRSNEDLVRFAYAASHDLQEPLRTVGSYAGLLGRRYQGQLDEQADKYIRFIVEGAKRMQSLIQDLLTYSRTGTQQLNIASADLNWILDSVKADLRIAIAERKAQIVSDHLPVLHVDAGKLGLVFQNLISNALKFSEPDRPPLIHISSVCNKQEWVVSVQDNGIGFDPQYAERIFIIFQRLHQVGTYPGTGIGLAICKRIIEGHGGRIWATSQPGVGSVFSFSLPAIPQNVGPLYETVTEAKQPQARRVGKGADDENTPD